MNPINLFSSFNHIQDIIFSYLSVEDLLTASLVSHEWFDTIASSSTCMKRIILSYGYKEKRNYGYPDQIRRRYEHFECLNFRPTNGLLKMLEKCNFIKSFRLFNKFSNVNELAQLLKVRPEIEELTIQGCFIDDDDDNECKIQLNFPKLKTLQLKYVDVECLIKLFESVRSLNTLVIYIQDTLKTETIRTFWKLIEANQESLINLTIISNDCGQLFQNIIKCDSSNLKSLEIREISMLEANEKINLLNFLISQKTSLEVLQIGEVSSLDIFKLIIEDMPMLRELSIHNHCINIKKLNLKENFSIRKLSLRSILLIKTLTQRCRAVTSLKICSLTDEVFHGIADTLPFLEELILESLNLQGNIAEGKFVCLKEISFKIYSKQVLQSPLSVSDNFHRLVAKEIGKLVKKQHSHTWKNRIFKSKRKIT